MKHLALIMDGNRRWAKSRGLMAWAGHKEGAQVISRVILFALKHRIAHISLYAFSIENLHNRTALERSYLLNLLIEQAVEQLGFFLEHNIKVKFIGDKTLFPDSVQPAIVELERNTAQGKALQLNILFCYGARQEILAAAKLIAHAVRAGTLDIEAITDEEFSRHLWTGDTPEPDLIVRTGGVQRLSNFLLYQGAYSEFYFFNCLWPELQEAHLEEAFNYYQSIQRNFGV